MFPSKRAQTQFKPLRKYFKVIGFEVRRTLMANGFGQFEMCSARRLLTFLQEPPWLPYLCEESFAEGPLD